ncbi:MAG: radical SAM protein [Elusimicrobia bacterium]|nr:radical SAM protein [Elusimicrobiota bacterium]
MQGTIPSQKEAPRGASVARVRAVLARRRWTLRRRRAAGAPRFTVQRAADQRVLCEIVLDSGAGWRGAGRSSLTPALRLRVLSRPGVAWRSDERKGLDELGAALYGLLEPLGRRDRGGARGPASAELHEGKGGREPLLRTTFACNQRCPFCFVPLTGRPAELAEISTDLDALARQGSRSRELMISGGEPTLDPRLPRILALARRKGFRRFVLQTNGVLLARPGRLESLVRLGVESFMVSFHARTPGLYDRVTGSRGQFSRAVAGLTRLLRCASCRVTVNVVVNRHNYRDLPGLVDFVADLAAGAGCRRRPEFYFSMINEAGHEKVPDWAVDLGDVAPFLRRAMARCRRRRLPVSRFGGETSFPVCLLREPGRHAAQRSFPKDRVRYAEGFAGEAGRLGRAKRPACRRCRFDARCLGVPAPYARLFGLGALRPPRG